MFPRLLLIILTAAATAACLLVIRQQRLELAHEAMLAHRRIEQRQRGLWELQQEVADQCRPDAVRMAMQRLPIEWVPIPTGPRQGSSPESAAVRLADGTAPRPRDIGG